MIVPVRSDLTAHSSSIKKKMMENNSIFYFSDSLLPLKKVKLPFAGCHYLLCAAADKNEHSQIIIL